jgi:hypothetical protein
MHIAITIWAVLAAWRWGDRKNWRKYHSTMLYMPLMNFLYYYFCSDHLLWEMIPDLGLSAIILRLLYTFIVFPCTVLVFLSNYPHTFKQQCIHYLKWIVIYVGVELIGGIFGRITYHNGWNLGWSALFISVMFPMLRLHYKKPVIAYFISIIIIILLLSFFDVTLDASMGEGL